MQGLEKRVEGDIAAGTGCGDSCRSFSYGKGRGVLGKKFMGIEGFIEIN